MVNRCQTCWILGNHVWWWSIMIVVDLWWLNPCFTNRRAQKVMVSTKPATLANERPRTIIKNRMNLQRLIYTLSKQRQKFSAVEPRSFFSAHKGPLIRFNSVLPGTLHPIGRQHIVAYRQNHRHSPIYSPSQMSMMPSIEMMILWMIAVNHRLYRI